MHAPAFDKGVVHIRAGLAGAKAHAVSACSEAMQAVCQIREYKTCGAEVCRTARGTRTPQVHGSRACTMESHSRMFARNWLPRPSPLLAPFTRPAMSTNSTDVGTTLFDFDMPLST